MKIYRIQLNYRLLGDLLPFIEYVRVKDDESIEEVINSVKERLYYEWDNAPLIEGVTYSLVEL